MARLLVARPIGDPMSRLGITLIALALASCAVIEGEPPRPTTTPTPAPDVARTRPTPIPTRPLNVSAECAFHDETGYRGNMKLDVANAQVRHFEAMVDVPRRGVCRFNLAEFRQTKTMPTVELSSSESRCVVRMWEQGRRVTVAFHQCAAKCTGEAFTFLWPILADSSTGSCG